jgi:ABC-type antimicrobial peptide transport system permease subunit
VARRSANAATASDIQQRGRELGVRLALGATRLEIVRLVGGQGLLLASSGIGVGCLAASALTRFITGRLHGVTPLDGPTFAFGALAMLVVAAAAIFLPVRRAASVDPVVALRAE